MAMTLKREEATPASYPFFYAGMSEAAAAMNAGIIWQRIETYVAHRWTPRQVAWTIEGPGWWSPDLAPATITAQEVWNGSAYEATTLNASPLGGLDLPGDGPYRITATVGAGPLPTAIAEAFRRLAEYMAETIAMPAGANRHEMHIGDLAETIDRNPAWLARAMVNSGAADLLRPYRRVW